MFVEKRIANCMRIKVRGTWQRVADRWDSRKGSPLYLNIYHGGLKNFEKLEKFYNLAE